MQALRRGKGRGAPVVDDEREAVEPALVLWPDADPYIDASFGDAYAAALDGPVEQGTIEGAGHWPWVDRPETIDRVAAFLAG